MELEAMKNMWQAHEQSLKKISTVNEKLVQRMIKDRSHNSLEKIKNTEYVFGSLTLMLFAIFIMMAWQLGGRTEMIVSYIITMAVLIITLVWSAYKIKYLSGIDVAGGAITETYKKTERFRLFIAKEKMWSIASIFVVAPPAYILVFQWVKHKSAFDFLRFSITELVMVLVLGVIFSIIIYRRLYFNNLKTILSNLQEIESFEK